MEFYLDQTCGAPDDLKLMAECTCLVCKSSKIIKGLGFMRLSQYIFIRGIYMYLWVFLGFWVASSFKTQPIKSLNYTLCIF